MKRTRSNRYYDNKSDSSQQIIDPYHLALATPKNGIHIINPVDGTIQRRKFKKHTRPIFALGQVARGRLLSASSDAIRVWNIQDGSHVELKCDIRLRYLVLELSKTQLIVEKREHHHSYPLIIWDYYENKTVELRGHTRPIIRTIPLIKTPSIQPKHHIATTSFDGTVRVWSTITGNQITMFTKSINCAIVGGIELQDGRLAFATLTGTVYIWDWEYNKTWIVIQGHLIKCGIHLMQLKTGGTNVRNRTDVRNQLVMYGPPNFGVKLVDISANEFNIRTIDKNQHKIMDVLLWNDFLISYSFDNVSFYNLQTQQQIEYSVNQIKDITLISNDRLALGSKHKFIFIWNLNNLDEPPQTFDVPSLIPFTIRELPDGRLLICSQSLPATYRRQCCILDLLSGKHFNYTTTANVPTIRTVEDRELCYNHVRDIFKTHLIPDICDLVSEFLVGHCLSSVSKRQKTQ